MLPWTHLTQHSKLHLDWHSRFCRAHGRESLYFTIGRHSPLKHASICAGVRRSGPCLTHGSLSLPESTPNDISIGSAVIAELTIVTDRLTDRPRYASPSSTAMRPKDTSSSRCVHLRIMLNCSYWHLTCRGRSRNLVWGAPRGQWHRASTPLGRG